MHFEVEYFETRARPQKVTISVSEKKWRFKGMSKILSPPSRHA